MAERAHSLSSDQDPSPAEEETERRLRVYETALSNTADFNYVFDLDGRFTYVNNALLALWQKPHSEAVGRNFFDLGYPLDLAARLQDQIQEVIRTRRPLRDETPYTSAIGTRAYEYIFVPVCAADGSVEAVTGSTRDITDRKDAEESHRRLVDQLSAADRRKDEFLALLAHELRGPLAPLRNGLLALRLLDGGEGPAAQSRLLMERQLAHLVRLVDDLLDISRVGNAKMELRRERITLAEVIRAATETAAPLLEERGHRLRVDIPPQDLWLDADLTRLAQVVSNLLANSAKYTSRNGAIAVSAAGEDGHVVVVVEDNGIGIPPEALTSIFDMFSQVNRTTEMGVGGLGLGLALVKGIVELHGGTVNAASEGIGRGSRFSVRLPLASAQERPRWENSHGASAGSV